MTSTSIARYGAGGSAERTGEYRVIKDERATVRFYQGDLTVAELLSDEEYEAFNAGTLVVLAENGGLLTLSSPAPRTIIVRAPKPEIDFQCFAFPINSAGELVRIDELLRIRAYEKEHPEVDLYSLSLEDMRGVL